MQIVTTTRDLIDVCTELSADQFVTVDTEFMREGTFWPELCLIQLAGARIEVLVDPIAPGIDLQPFFALMSDERVMKVFHAARQDVEIIYKRAGIIPQPIFDTQIAAMVCGYGESVSYFNLVKSIVGADVDKSSQFTDWASRPLSHKQLEYAIGDVRHLRPIYEHLRRKLDRSGRTEWLFEEISDLTSPTTYESDPEKAWQRLKLRVRSRRALGVLMEVAEWRDRTAQKLNVPRNRVLKDDAIYDIANQTPQTTEQLSKLRMLNDGFARSARGQEVLAAVKRGLARDPRQLPALDRSTGLPPEASATMDLLRVLLKSVCAEHGVAAKLVATTEDLERLAQEAEPAIPALRGWRRELFGDAALKLKQGRLALKIENGSIRTFEPI